MAETEKNNELVAEKQNLSSTEEFDKDKEYHEFLQVIDEINAELKEELNEETVVENKGEPEGETVAKETSATKNREEQSEKTGEDSAINEEYKKIRLGKICSKINYDLSSPTLTVNEIKERIVSSINFKFNRYAMLTSKIKGVKKLFKEVLPICAVIGLGESTLGAKLYEIKEAKKLKVNEIELLIPLSVIKENKKKALVKELVKCRKQAGKINFKIAIDCKTLTVNEFNFALSCAVESKPYAVCLKNYSSASEGNLLTAIKQTLNKCELQIDGAVSGLKDITLYEERGVDFFLIQNAVAVISAVKNEL